MNGDEFTIREKDLIEFKKRRYVRLEIQKAIRKGEIVRPETCQLCAGKKGGIEAHHVDYGKPYEIKWLCSPCHGLAHRSDHPLNPANNPQSQIRGVDNAVLRVDISFSLPIKNYLAIKAHADKKNSSVSALIRQELEQKYPVAKDQLEFKFMKEMKNELTSQPAEQSVRASPGFRDTDLPSVDTHEGLLQQRILPLLCPIRREGDKIRSSVEFLFQFPEGFGGNARKLQRPYAS